MTAAPSHETVRVDLGARSYDILIGPDLLEQAGQHLAPLVRRPRIYVLTDQNVAGHHLDRLSASLGKAGLTIEPLILEPGESTKSLAILDHVLGWLFEKGANRDDVLAALGGGVIGDLTGLTAALMKRGMGFVQIPTTLLAQVDSSVGGKTAINSPFGKNLIGAFYQPRLVLADTDVLATLPERERLAGYAEVVKYGLIDRADFFDWLDTQGPSVRALEPAALTHAVAVSCQAKAGIVAQDEREGGVRALLNLGHTFGHALEAANGFGHELLHGEAVGTGMALAFGYSARLGLCTKAEAARVIAHLQAAGFQTSLGTLPGGPYKPAELVQHMRQDKKARGDRVPLILARGIGRSFIYPEADLADVEAFLEEESVPA